MTIRTGHSPLAQAKDVARKPFAWPGGYPKYLVMTDGGCLCPACVRSEFALIARADRTGCGISGWEPAAADINWEDESLFCDHCNKQIESAYGD